MQINHRNGSLTLSVHRATGALHNKYRWNHIPPGVTCGKAPNAAVECQRLSKAAQRKVGVEHYNELTFEYNAD